MKERKSRAGRPPLYNTPEELRKAVDLYFDRCEGEPAIDENGTPVTDRRGVVKMVGAVPPTLSGLSYSLGYADRRIFTRQKYRGAEFANVVMYARLRVEQAAEERLFDRDGYRGAAFMLRACFGWGQEEKAPQEAAGVEFVACPPEDANKDGTAYHGVSIEYMN